MVGIQPGLLVILFVHFGVCTLMGFLILYKIVEVTSRFYDLRVGNCRLAVITCEIPYHIRSTRK
jgi:hypothetical protein